MAKLTPIDWLIMLLYFVFVVGIGFALKREDEDQQGFFSGRAGAAGVDLRTGLYQRQPGSAGSDRHGRVGGQVWAGDGTVLRHGAIPAMIFVGIFMMPFYYGSKARRVPEFLRLRFDEKTRALNACSFAVMTVFSSGHLDVCDGAADAGTARV